MGNSNVVIFPAGKLTEAERKEWVAKATDCILQAMLTQITDLREVLDDFYNSNIDREAYIRAIDKPNTLSRSICQLGGQLKEEFSLPTKEIINELLDEMGTRLESIKR